MSVCSYICLKDSCEGSGLSTRKSPFFVIQNSVVALIIHSITNTKILKNFYGEIFCQLQEILDSERDRQPYSKRGSWLVCSLAMKGSTSRKEA